MTASDQAADVWYYENNENPEIFARVYEEVKKILPYVNENICIVPRRQANENGDGLVKKEGADEVAGENEESEDDYPYIAYDPLANLDLDTAVRIIQKFEKGRQGRDLMTEAAQNRTRLIIPTE